MTSDRQAAADVTALLQAWPATPQRVRPSSPGSDEAAIRDAELHELRTLS